MENLEEMSLQQIIEEYENGKSLEEIAGKKTLVSKIKRELLEHGGENGKKILLQELERQPSAKEIIEDYINEKQFDEISKKYGRGINKINDIIQEYKMITGFSGKRRGRRSRVDLSPEEITDEYAQGKTYKVIADEKNISATTVRRKVMYYKEANGDSAIEQHKKENAKSKKQVIRKNKIELPIKEIIERRQKGETYRKIAITYDVSEKLIGERVRYYQAQKGKTIELSMIINYFILGYSLDKVQQIAEEYSCIINENDLETARKIENGKLKVASEDSIAKIIEKYGYSYEALVEVAEQKGYVVLRDKYISAKNSIKDRNEEGEERL